MKLEDLSRIYDQVCLDAEKVRLEKVPRLSQKSNKTLTASKINGHRKHR